MDYLRKISKITNREYYESKDMNYDEMKSMFSEELLSTKFHVDDYFYSDFLLGLGMSRNDSRYMMKKLCNLGYLRKEHFSVCEGEKKRFLKFYPSNTF